MKLIRDESLASKIPYRQMASSSSRLDYLLTKAQVPRLHRRQIRRKAFERFEYFMQRQLDSKENFCILVDGIAGCGKTNLICDFLWSRSDVCGYYFKKVIWLTDRNSNPKNVAGLGMDALLLLPNAMPLDFAGVDQPDSSHSLYTELQSYQRPGTMKIMLAKSLAESPKTLLIIDDVLLRETVDLFANLNCSIIVTSTRTEIFDHIDKCQAFHLGMDDVYIEDVSELCCKYDIDSIGEHSAREIIKMTGGNFALMEKLLISSKSDTQKLQLLMDQLPFGQLDLVKCVSYYQYSSLNTCFNIMTKLIDRRFVEDLPTLAVLQPSTWIDIDVVSLVWPVDMPDSNQTKISLLVSKDMDTLGQNSLIEHQIRRKTANQIDHTRIEPILFYYLLSIGDSQSLLNTLNFFKADLQKKKSTDEFVSKTFQKYLIDNEANMQNLEKVLKQPKRRVGIAGLNEPKDPWLISRWISKFFW